jgi:hypothetical protein
MTTDNSDKALAAFLFKNDPNFSMSDFFQQPEASENLDHALRSFLDDKKPDPEAACLQGMKDGATAAVLAIVSTLEKSWIMRLAMRITPLTVLRKLAKGLPAAVDQLPPG